MAIRKVILLIFSIAFILAFIIGISYAVYDGVQSQKYFSENEGTIVVAEITNIYYKGLIQINVYTYSYKGKQYNRNKKGYDFTIGDKFLIKIDSLNPSHHRFVRDTRGKIKKVYGLLPPDAIENLKDTSKSRLFR